MKRLDGMPLPIAIEWLAQRLYDTRDRCDHRNSECWNALNKHATALSKLGAREQKKADQQQSTHILAIAEAERRQP